MTELSHKPCASSWSKDMQSDADLLVRHLTRAGFAIDHRRVDTAEAMRQALADGTWDLILCDCKMPGFDAPAALGSTRNVASTSRSLSFPAPSARKPRWP